MTLSVPRLPALTVTGWRDRSLWKAVTQPAVVAILTAFLTTRLVLVGLIYFSSITLPMRPGELIYTYPHNLIHDGLVRWDSFYYAAIAEQGYNLGNPANGVLPNVVFFPLYPLLIRTLASVLGDRFIAGVVISNLACFIALIYLYRLVRREWGGRAAGRAVFYVAAAPTAIFFSSIYSESLFLALVAATFYYARAGHWRLAAVAGALGAATRNTGISLALVIAIEGLSQAGVFHRWRWWRGAAETAPVPSKSPLGPSLVAAGCATLGLVAYLAYLGITFGDPLAFVHQQINFGRDVGPERLVGIVGSTANRLILGPDLGAGQVNAKLVLDALFTLGFGGLVIAVLVRLRPAYGVYSLATFLAPLASGTISSMTRYSLMLLPCFMLLAIWGRRPWVDRLVLGLWLPGFAYFTVLFSHWYFAG